MLQIQPTRISRRKVTSKRASIEYDKTELLGAQANFCQYRITMNPRFILRGKWFPQSLARTLRQIPYRFQRW
jgi:hypothetical protein